MHDPLHWLAGDLRDEVVAAVVVQQDDAFPFGHSSDKQIGETHGSHPPRSAESDLYIKRVPRVLVVNGKPFVAGVTIDA